MNWELGMKFMPRAIRISEIWQRWSSGGRPAHPVSAVCVCVCVLKFIFSGNSGPRRRFTARPTIKGLKKGEELKEREHREGRDWVKGWWRHRWRHGPRDALHVDYILYTRYTLDTLDTLDTLETHTHTHTHRQNMIPSHELIQSIINNRLWNDWTRNNGLRLGVWVCVCVCVCARHRNGKKDQENRKKFPTHQMIFLLVWFSS